MNILHNVGLLLKCGRRSGPGCSGQHSAWDAFISYHIFLFESKLSLLFQLPDKAHSRRQQGMDPVLRSLLPMLDIWIEFLIPGFFKVEWKYRKKLTFKNYIDFSILFSIKSYFFFLNLFGGGVAEGEVKKISFLLAHCQMCATARTVAPM